VEPLIGYCLAHWALEHLNKTGAQILALAGGELESRVRLNSHGYVVSIYTDPPVGFRPYPRTTLTVRNPEGKNFEASILWSPFGLEDPGRERIEGLKIRGLHRAVFHGVATYQEGQPNG